MGSATATQVEAPRIDATDFKDRLAAGERATVLDVRAPAAWDASNEKIAGAVRTTADQLRIDPSWPKSQLTVAYCT
jgi:hypothetical protein